MSERHVRGRGADSEEAVATDHRQPLHPEAAAGSARSTTTREGTSRGAPDASPGLTSTWLPVRHQPLLKRLESDVGKRREPARKAPWT